MERISGEQRKACVRPPDDILECLPQEEVDTAPRKAQTSSWSDLIWNLLKPAYRLKDAPFLWIMNLCKKGNGASLVWVE